MSEFKVRRCHECGQGRVRPVARRGRYIRYKTFPRLEIPATVEIPTCDRCGAEWTNDTVGEKLDRALEKAYRKALVTRAQAALKTLTKHFSQASLESLLGLSPGYLSKVNVGAREPSPELVAHLAMLARAPKARVRELEQYWESGNEDAA